MVKPVSKNTSKQSAVAAQKKQKLAPTPDEDDEDEESSDDAPLQVRRQQPQRSPARRGAQPSPVRSPNTSFRRPGPASRTQVPAVSERPGPASSKPPQVPSRNQTTATAANERASTRSKAPPPAADVRPPRAGGAAKRKAAPPKKAADYALNEIARLQREIANILPKAPFSRLVREIMNRLDPNCGLRITAESLEALQEATEIYFVQLFDDANRIVLNRNQVTLQIKDLDLLLHLRGSRDPGFGGTRRRQ